MESVRFVMTDGSTQRLNNVDLDVERMKLDKEVDVSVGQGLEETKQIDVLIAQLLEDLKFKAVVFFVHLDKLLLIEDVLVLQEKI